MSKTSLSMLALLLLLAGPATDGPALEAVESLRCGSNLVQIGDTKAEVLSRCGEPALREKIRRGTSARKSKAKSGSTAEERYREDEQWTYNLGPQDFHYTLTFEGMELKAIGRGGRGTRR